MYKLIKKKNMTSTRRLHIFLIDVLVGHVGAQLISSSESRSDFGLIKMKSGLLVITTGLCEGMEMLSHL